MKRLIDKGELSAAGEGQYARSTYRTKVFDDLFKQSSR